MKHVHQFNTLVDDLEAVLGDIRDNAPPGKHILVNEKGRAIKVLTKCGLSKTEQSYADDLDINRLLEPAMRKGLLRHSVQFEGEYDDIPVGDFQEAQFIVAKAKSMFEQLPSATRTKFENDPGKFMKFVQDPDNKPWLQAQGVLKGLDGLDKDGNPTGYNPGKEIADKNAALAAQAAENENK